jgi:hypothetical protein
VDQEERDSGTKLLSNRRRNGKIHEIDNSTDEENQNNAL